MSIISQETRDDFSSSRSLLTKKTSTKPPRDSHQRGQFQPKRSKSIHRQFDKKIVPEQDNDIWIERIVLNGSSGQKKTFFKSLRGNVVRNEPPTGAMTIIYLEDIIVDRRQASSSNKKSPKTKPQPKPQPQPQQSQSQQREIISSSVPKEGTNLGPVAGMMVDKREQLQKVEPKRRASFFGFMKKNRKNQTDGATDTK
jgi:hypothetical protein